MEQVLVDFRPWYVKRGYTSSKRIILVFILTFYASPLHWYWILCFSHLWKLPSPVEFCCHILINKGKYQNILPMPVFANSPCCMLIGMVFVDRDAYTKDDYVRDGYIENFHVKNLRIIFNLVASSAASEFCKWLQIQIQVHIPYRKHQVKLYFSLCFLNGCAIIITDRNHLFCISQRN